MTNWLAICSFSALLVTLLFILVELKAMRKERQEAIWQHLVLEFNKIIDKIDNWDGGASLPNERVICRMTHGLLDGLDECLKIESRYNLLFIFKESERHKRLKKWYNGLAKFYCDKLNPAYVQEIFPHPDPHVKIMQLKRDCNLNNYKDTRKSVEKKWKKIGFIIHLSVYILANIVLTAYNCIYVPGIIFYIYPLIIWGIGIFGFHLTFAILLFDKLYKKQDEEIEKQLSS